MNKPDLTLCKTVLILCPIGIGNYLMAQPAIENIVKRLGKEKVSLLALKPGIAKIARESERFHEVVEWFPDSQSLSSGLKTLRTLRKRRYDATVSLFPTGHWKYSLFNWAINAPIKVGFSYPNTVLPKVVQSYSISTNANLHDTDQNLLLTKELLGVDNYSGYRFPGKKFFVGIDNAEERFYVCHPGSSAERGMDKKRFPASAYAEIISKIYKVFGYRCYLAGDASEEKLRIEITELVEPEAVIALSCKSLNELSGILAESLFYFGNDSGIMHMSVAEEKRCLVLFGPTDEKRTGPYFIDGARTSNEHLIVRDTALPCAPCWTFKTLGKNKPCKFGDYRCTQKFSPIEEWESIKLFVESL